MEPAKIIHSAEHHVQYIAIRPRNTHSLFMDAVFNHAFWMLIIILVIGLAVAILVW